jgi:hypothetical protein
MMVYKSQNYLVSGLWLSSDILHTRKQRFWSDSFLKWLWRHPLNVIPQKEILITEQPMSKSKLLYEWRSVSMSWYRAPLWDLRSDTTSCRSVAVWNLRSYFCGEPSLTRGRVCNLQCNHSLVRVAQKPLPYFTVSSETPPTWRARFPYLYLPGTGWPSYTPGHWVPFTSPLTTHSELAGSYFTTDSQ